MQEKRHDCVVEMRLCFFSRKAGDYKMLFVATRKCRSTAEEELKRMEEFRKAQAEVEQKKEKPMSQKMFKVV